MIFSKKKRNDFVCFHVFRQLNQEILEWRGKAEDAQTTKNEESQKTEAEEKAMKKKVDQHL